MSENVVKGDNYRLYKGDCVQSMKEIEDHTIGAIITDPPYNTTRCDFETDIIKNIDDFWNEWDRIIIPYRAKVFTAAQPFSSRLVVSKLDQFKYEWVWEKTLCGGFMNAKARPLKIHELVLIFSDGKATSTDLPDRMLYNPQGVIHGKWIHRGKKRSDKDRKGHKLVCDAILNDYLAENTNYPRDIIIFPNGNNFSTHPTEKPVALMEYLIRTYSNMGDTVLDPFMGVGSTGVAAMNSGRKFIGMELDDEYFEVACKKLKDAEQNMKSKLFTEGAI